MQVTAQRRCPRSGPLRPFDQHDGAFAHHVVEAEVPSFGGGAESVAVDVIDGWPSWPLVPVHERIRGARRRDARPEPPTNGLDEGRLAGAELTREPDHDRRPKVAPERFTEPVEFVRG